ncbi:MAG TPA: DUF6318 family protein [Kribbellaceae bacterium]|nr:DUF6318 family protein [Kribbellaceae bacterium]
MERTSQAMSIVAAVAMLTLLTACDGDPESMPPPSSSTSPSSTPLSSATPSTTPKPTAPTVPPAATNGLTVTSAEAFARFYLQVLDHLEGTGDASLMRRWADPSCKSCRLLASTFEDVYKKGGAVTGDYQTVDVKVSEARLSGADTAFVRLSGSEGTSYWRKSSGSAPSTFAPHEVRWELTLAALEGHWAMFAMVKKA